MARFAPVCPPQILEYFKNEGCLGDYHLVLAHDIAKQPARYLKIFDRPQWSSTEIILDNSVIELGGAVDVDVIIAAALAIRPTTTVLPDVLLDSKMTIQQCMAALPIWVEKFQAAGLEPNFMLVPQGTSLEQWISCAEQFATAKYINFWGIPRNMVKILGSRHSLPEILHALNPSRMIHLLGFSDNIVDDIVTSKNMYVHGIDSAVPIRAISQGINYMWELNKMPPRGTWWEDATPDSRMIDAFMTARQWFRRTR